jgi:hypothetical protein
MRVSIWQLYKAGRFEEARAIYRWMRPMLDIDRLQQPLPVDAPAAGRCRVRAHRQHRRGRNSAQARLPALRLAAD